MGQGLIRNLAVEELTEPVEAVAIFPAKLDEICLSSPEVRTHVVVVLAVELHVLLFMSVGEVETVDQFPAVFTVVLSHGVLLQALDPFFFALADGEDEFAARKHLVQLLVH